VRLVRCKQCKLKYCRCGWDMWLT